MILAQNEYEFYNKTPFFDAAPPCYFPKSSRNILFLHFFRARDTH